jgi:hypothetical protein
LTTNKNPRALVRLWGSVENPLVSSLTFAFASVGSLSSYLPRTHHTPAGKINLRLVGILLIEVMCVHRGVLRCLDPIKANAQTLVNPQLEDFSPFVKTVV